MIFKPQVFPRTEEEEKKSIGDYYVSYYSQREELISLIEKELSEVLDKFRGNENVQIWTRKKLNHDAIGPDSTWISISIEIKPERKIDYIRTGD